jgi:GNAT superfamily N-acetyltransferase
VVHSRLRRTLTVDDAIEILSFFVDDRHRGLGLGAAMLDYLGQWAVRLDCMRVRVASHVIRSRVRRFYEAHVFVKAKHLAVLEKVGYVNAFLTLSHNGRPLPWRSPFHLGYS